MIAYIGFHHNWSRSTVHLITMETPYACPWYSLNSDNSLTPNSQWPGRTFSPAIERSHEVFIRYHSLDQVIFLGIHTTFKQDCHCTAAKLVYGTTLRLPGDYFNSTLTSSQLEPHSYATQLKTITHKLQPSTICNTPYIPMQTFLHTHMFLYDMTELLQPL